MFIYYIIQVNMKSLIILSVLLYTVYADIKACHPSKADGEKGCDADECCIPEMEFFKVSKRDVMPDIMDLKPVFPWGNRAGRCVKYMQEGENCYSMASWQTCGCSDGLSCHYTPHPSETKRAIPPQYRPKGVHACIKSD